MKYCLISFLIIWSIGLYAQDTSLREVEKLMAKSRYYEVLKCVD